MVRRRSRLSERSYQLTLKTDDRLAWSRQVCEMHAFYMLKESVHWYSRIDASSRNLKTSMPSVLDCDWNASIQPSSIIAADKLAPFDNDKIEGVRAATDDAATPVLSF